MLANKVKTQQVKKKKKNKKIFFNEEHMMETINKTALFGFNWTAFKQPKPL